MDDATRDSIISKIDELRLIRKRLDLKAREVQEVSSGLGLLLHDAPKNIDCTDMTDEQISLYSTNLLTLADGIINE